MSPLPSPPFPGGKDSTAGYLIVLFVLIIAFVGVVSAMQMLVLTSVGTTSRAYDSYRQTATEAVRLERAVAEALYDVRQISASPGSPPLTDALQRRLSELSPGGTSITATVVPSSVPVLGSYPNPALPPAPLLTPTVEVLRLLTPEFSHLLGARAASSPEMRFEFSSTRVVLDTPRTYRTQVKAVLVAVPLTRFAVAAYELPADIGAGTLSSLTGPFSNLPGGLVPGRDDAFVADVQAQPGVLPYHYRRRAALAGAYQYVFSQAFIDRVSEYAGVTHYLDLDAATGTALLAGMTRAGNVASWDLGLAGRGTYNTISDDRDAAVVVTGSGSNILRLYDSVGNSGAAAFFLLVQGPADPAAGALVLELATLARPVVVVGSNIRIRTTSAAMINGALLLDPASAIDASSTLRLAHLSYWAGSHAVPNTVAPSGAMPSAAESMAPRVVYVATAAVRL